MTEIGHRRSEGGAAPRAPVVLEDGRDAEDTVFHDLQPATRDQAVDGPLTESESSQLRPRYAIELPSSELSDASVPHTTLSRGVWDTRPRRGRRTLAV